MNIDQIIAKVLAGKASQEELSALDTWKKEAQDNILAIKEMQSIDSTIEQTAEYKEYSVDDAWSVMQTKMDTTETTITQTEAKVVSFQWMKMAVAACTVFLLAFVGWNYVSGDGAFSPESYASAEIGLDATLIDGSNIKLDVNSVLDTKSERAVALEGRAFFKVAKSPDDQFTVQLPEGKITVLGTEFVVDTRQREEKIFVVEGKVRYEHEKRKIDLTAGELLVLKDGDIMKVMSEGNEMTLWMESKLAFRDKPLTDVIKSLEIHFGRKIIVDDVKAMKKCRVNTTITNETLEDILNELSLTLGLKYHTIDNTIHIVQSNC